MPENPITGRPMAPVQEVFGGERQTPHARFQQSRAESGWTPENPGGTAVAHHRRNDLALACPSCRSEGTPGVRMFSELDRGYYCLSGKHSWKDIDALLALNPDRLEFRGHKTQQTGFRKVEVEVPEAVAEAFVNKFGTRGAATISAVMDVLSKSRSMILGEGDLRNIEERLGQEVKNSSMLAGSIFALKSQVQEHEATITRLRNNLAQVGRGQHMSDSTVVVDLGDELASKLQETVQSKDWTAEAYIIEAVRLGIEGGWV